MLDDVDPAASYFYQAAFDRRNLCSRELETKSPGKLRTRAQRMVRTFPAGSTVVLLGNDVARAFSPVLSKALQRILIHPQVIDGITWRLVPHPSGRTQFYNDPVLRSVVGMLLSDLYHGEYRAQSSN